MKLMMAKQVVKVVATAMSELCRRHKVRACGMSRVMEMRMKTLIMSLGLAGRMCSIEESQSKAKQVRKDRPAAAKPIRLLYLERADEIKRVHWLIAKNDMMACLQKCVHDLARFASCRYSREARNGIARKSRAHDATGEKPCSKSSVESNLSQY